MFSSHQLLLAELDMLALGGGIVAGVVVGAIASVALLKMLKAQGLSSAKQEAEKLLSSAKSESDTLLRQADITAREEIAKRREEAEANLEKELNQAREQFQQQQRESEQRIEKREDKIDGKLELLANREKNMQESEKVLKESEQRIVAKESKLDQLVTKHNTLLADFDQTCKTELLRISRMSEGEAKEEALKRLQENCEHDAEKMVRQIVERAQDDAQDQALKITLQAIQRYASEHTSAHTVSTVDIPSDEMKGRVIGREGRNIRSFEQVTGVDVIVDDTPGVVVVSCFDPVRRAVAAETLSLLIEDGRIHPARIEELYNQVQEDMEQRIVKYGKEACLEANIQGLNGRITAMMGRLYFRTSYGQNILRHSIEVAFLSQVIAEEIGLNGEIARRAGFLHDIGKAMDHEVEGGHPAIGMDFCRKFGEKEEVLNAVGGHHDDIPHTTPYTAVVMAADAISSSRPGARRETLEKYVKRLQELEAIATRHPGVHEAFAIQAGREIRVVVDPRRVDDPKCHLLAREISQAISDEMTFPGEIKITVLREMRTVEYAR